MLSWAIIALIISVIAGALGFSGVAQGAASIAKLIFGIFLIIAALLFFLMVLGIEIIT